MEYDVFNKLRALTINIRDGGASQRITDKEYMRLYIDGKKEGNMYKQYELIDAMERGGLNLPQIELIRILKEAFEIDEDSALSIINDKTDILTISFIGYGLQESVKKRIIRDSAITNPIIKFEMIRQTLKSDVALDEDTFEAVTQGCVQISELDAMVFSFMLNKLQYQRDFFIVMGRALNILSDSAIKMYAENIDLQRSADYFEQVNTLLAQIEDEKWDEVLGSLAGIIYRKWNALLDKTKFAKGINGIIICSYSSLILYCMLKLFSNKDDFYTELNRILETCDKCIYTWYPDGSRMQTVYFVCTTQLYMLNLVQQNHKFDLNLNKALKDKLQMVCDLLGNYRDFWKYVTNGKTLDDAIVWNT